jgi:hypothetical protein
MFDRIELIRALNPILELMFDGFCQVCSTLAIYRKVRKNSLSAQFSVERYIALIIKSFSSSSRFHHQVNLIIKPFSSSRSHHQALLIIKSYYQATVASQSIKSTYQVILSSHSIKSYYQAIVASILWGLATVACYDCLLRSLLSACYDLIEWLDKMTW